jgi:electron transport complex protein RnfC
MKLKTFKPGGVHLHDQKHFTASFPLETMPEPEVVIIPLSQHIGLPAKALVSKGDKVLMGQMIAEAQGGFSVPVHSSVSGTVDTIGSFPHPVHGSSEAIRIISDGKSEWQNKSSDAKNTSKLFSSEELLRLIQDAGIVGMGGATFPSHIKLSPPKEHPVDTLIINGAECEPYLTCDHRIMLEKTDILLEGVSILADLLKIKSVFIGIEENKKDCIHQLNQRLQELNSETKPMLIALKEKYPQGAEKSLIFACNGRTVPVGKLPYHVGVIVQNVATVVAIAEAVQLKKPLIERALTVTGDLVRNPKNLWVRIGTPIQNAIDYCGGMIAEPDKVILGGPMMGLAQRSLDIPVTKGVSGILLMSHAMLKKETACIRCGQCIINCPAGLMPLRIKELSQSQEYEKAKQYHALSCIECGICSYQCPAYIPLLTHIRDVKAEINKRSRKS